MNNFLSQILCFCKSMTIFKLKISTNNYHESDENVESQKAIQNFLNGEINKEQCIKKIKSLVRMNDELSCILFIFNIMKFENHNFVIKTNNICANDSCSFVQKIKDVVNNFEVNLDINKKSITNKKIFITQEVSYVEMYGIIELQVQCSENIHHKVVHNISLRTKNLKLILIKINR